MPAKRSIMAKKGSHSVPRGTIRQELLRPPPINSGPESRTRQEPRGEACPKE